MDGNIFKLFSSFLITSSLLLTFLPPIPPSSHTHLPPFPSTPLLSLIASVEEACQAVGAIEVHRDGMDGFHEAREAQLEWYMNKMFMSSCIQHLSLFYNRAILEEDRRLKRQQEEALHLSVSEALAVLLFFKWGLVKQVISPHFIMFTCLTVTFYPFNVIFGEGRQYNNPTCGFCVFLRALGELKLHDFVNSTFVKSCDLYNVISMCTLTVF